MKHVTTVEGNAALLNVVKSWNSEKGFVAKKQTLCGCYIMNILQQIMIDVEIIVEMASLIFKKRCCNLSLY
jgi:hypothetical protein